MLLINTIGLAYSEIFWLYRLNVHFIKYGFFIHYDII
jgi:hypothetical protein